jgi:hypothetical protein
MVFDRPGLLLRLEGLALLAAALVLFFDTESSWLWLLLLLWPDVSFAAYAAGPRVGAIAYNLLHTTIGPLILGAIGVLADSGSVVVFALVWAAHAGMDRALGYGLKYPTAFKDTHLQRV